MTMRAADVDRCGRKHERRPQRTGGRNHVLLAGARDQRRRHDVCRRRGDGVLEFHHRCAAGGVQQVEPGERRDGPVADPDAELGCKHGRDELRVLLRHDE